MNLRAVKYSTQSSYEAMCATYFIIITASLVSINKSYANRCALMIDHRFSSTACVRVKMSFCNTLKCKTQIQDSNLAIYMPCCLHFYFCYFKDK